MRGWILICVIVCLCVFTFSYWVCADLTAQHPSAYTYTILLLKRTKRRSRALIPFRCACRLFFPNVSSHVLIPINEHIPFDFLNIFWSVLYYFLVEDDVYVSRCEEYTCLMRVRRCVVGPGGI